MPQEVDPGNSAMRASVYNPYGKMLGKPYLKTPKRLDDELFASIDPNYNPYQYQNLEYPTSRYSANRNTQSTSNLNSRVLFDNTPNMQTPGTFHERKQEEARWIGEPGQKFTYAALNSDVKNSIQRSMKSSHLPFHMRTSKNRIPTSDMSPSFLPAITGQSGYVTTTYNANGVKPSSRLEPLHEGIFTKDDEYSTRGPLPQSVMDRPSAIYIVHYANRNEECVIRYMMDTMMAEKNIFKYSIPRDPSTVQISPTQLLMSGGIKRGTRNTPSGFCAIFECITGDLVLLPDMQIPRHGHALAYL